LPGNLFYILGPIANTSLFVFISIPLMEKRQLQTKPEYEAYRNKTWMLIPLPEKHGSFDKTYE
jgi:steroid 5-alpha reductase family enzyme